MKLLVKKCCLAMAILSFAGVGAEQTSACAQSDLDVIVEQPQYIKKYTSYKILVSAKYAPWVSKTEELDMLGKLESDQQKTEMLDAGNMFAIEVANSIESFHQHIVKYPSKTCQSELEHYITSSLTDFQKWHVEYILKHKLMN